MSIISFKQLLAENEFLVIPGAYDCITAKLIQEAGYKGVYMTGFGVSASSLGYPDYGLVTMNEMVARAGNIVDSVHLPVIADADTGYGNVINVKRTVELYERAGVTAIHLEDQLFPKKCGHFEGKQLISKEEHGEKIKAAVVARKSTDFGIIARTDASGVEGIQSAIDRAKYYIECGADAIFLDAPKTLEDIQTFGAAFAGGVPILINIVEKEDSPYVTPESLKDYGYKIALYPITLLLASVNLMTSILRQINHKQGTHHLHQYFESFDRLNQLLDVDSYKKWEKQFSSGGE